MTENPPVIGEIREFVNGSKRWDGTGWRPTHFGVPEPERQPGPFETIGRNARRRREQERAESGVDSFAADLLLALAIALAAGVLIGLLAFCVWLVVT